LLPCDGHSGSSSQPPLRILGYTEGVRRVLHTIRANTRSASSSRAPLGLSSIDEGAREQPPHFHQPHCAGFRIPPSPPLLVAPVGHSDGNSQPTLRILGYTEGVRRVLHTNRANARSASSSRAALALSSIDEGAREQPPHFHQPHGAGFRIPPSPPFLLPCDGHSGSSSPPPLRSAPATPSQRAGLAPPCTRRRLTRRRLAGKVPACTRHGSPCGRWSLPSS
jgi:hypothetical protein